MAEAKTASASKAPINVVSVIAVLTLLGGAIIASKKLTSDRPLAYSERPQNPAADQTIEARLWEDPFKWRRNEAQATNEAALALLQDQIRSRRTGDSRPMLLAVMAQGGTYSEDIEARIRTRFAIVAALSEGGYTPESAEHLGGVLFPWPGMTEFRCGSLTNDCSLEFACTNKASALSLTNTNNIRCCDQLRASFEWYRFRDFQAGRLTNNSPRDALLLWLDEDQFADHPQIRLALLLRALAGITNCDGTNCTDELFSRIAIIGPRTSATLRAMLPPYGATNYASFHARITEQARLILKHVDLYTATPSAMDEALVQAQSGGRPRQSIEAILTNHWFKACRNFAATDGQLAAEVLRELQLRNVDLKHPDEQHLVLVSEWDTFYGRILSLTYAAELASMQHPNRFNDRSEFIRLFREGKDVWPTNLHSFVYLRGLDGQTIKSPSGEGAGGTTSGRDKTPVPLDLKHWTPDENKAVGAAQFDYLARLGDRIAHCEKRLTTEGRGRVGAIGIVGSDVYDTLLLLQALRPRFPEAVFFTTDLDARFCHPQEQDWSRNLVVVSGYGLQLEPTLQHRIAPFRDSTQTAQFAATLAALGNPQLQQLGTVPPRRFEIARGRAYDLSVTEGSPLHPTPLALRGLPHLAFKSIAGIVLLTVFGILYLTGYWRALRRGTWEARQTELESLWFREEDLGGECGFAILTEKLKESSDPLAKWLWAGFLRYKNPDGRADQHGASRRLIDFLNSHPLQENMPDANIKESKALSEQTQNLANQTGRNSFRRLLLNRQILSELFTWLCEPKAQTIPTRPNP